MGRVFSGVVQTRLPSCASSKSVLCMIVHEDVCGKMSVDVICSLGDVHKMYFLLHHLYIIIQCLTNLRDMFQSSLHYRFQLYVY